MKAAEQMGRAISFGRWVRVSEITYNLKNGELNFFGIEEYRGKVREG